MTVGSTLRGIMWIFGYGSLIWDDWEKDFSCTRRLTAELHGYRRTFNKLSIKNWGTKSNPGPTLNLELADRGICTGIAFEFPDEQSMDVQSYLAAREGKGFVYKSRTVVVAELGERSVLVSFYAGKNLVSTSTVRQLADQIVNATGTSGNCYDYVRDIHSELSKLGIDDPVVSEVWNAVKILAVK